MSTQHTPGPWVQNLAEQHYIHDADVIVGSMDDEGCFREICTMDEHRRERAEAKANAKLIEAAPDLYEALKAMVEAHGGLGVSPAMQKATAALAKVQS